jgi:tellurite methyltransferase
VNDWRERARIDAGPNDSRRHRDAHGECSESEDRLSRQRDSTVLVALQAALQHGILDSLPLPDEIEHHHRVSEEQKQRGEKPEGEVQGEVAALNTDDRRGDQPDHADSDRREQRLSQEPIISDLPSPFVVAWLGPVSRLVGRSGVAIDLAMGSGRHAELLARAGFRTFGVDIKLDAVRHVAARVRSEGLTVGAWCGDLTQIPLPRERFDVVLVTRFLDRDLFASIRSTLKSGGILLYETFTVAQRRLGFGPTSPRHLLEPGELARLLEGFEVLMYEEVEAPEAVARIVARRPRITA